MDTTKIKAVLFVGKTYKDGSHPIMIRVTQNRKRLYKSVGHSVVRDAWNEDLQRVYEKKPQITKRQEEHLNPQKLAEKKETYKHAVVPHNAETINSDIQDRIDEIEGINQKLKVNDEVNDLHSIKKNLNPTVSADRNKSFLVFGKEVRDNFLKAGSIGTHKSYKSILTKLEEYLGKRDLLFADITVQFLYDYEAHLQSLENKQGTIHNNLKSIRAIYYAAIAQEFISQDKNPFFVFKLKSNGKTKKDKLNVDEIVAIEGLSLKDDTLLYHVRNFFLFSFYCAGIRASDVLQLKCGDIGKDNRLEYQMDKTGHHKSIGLIPKALEILKHYKRPKSKDTDFLFPFIDTTQDLTNKQVLHNQISSCTALVNKYLKDLATSAEIGKVITTHIARHSFADIARSRKASIYDISKMLGHSSIKVTEAYLASLDIESQDETMKAILDF